MTKADAEYVLERIQSMEPLLAAQTDSEGRQAMDTLKRFRLRVEGTASSTDGQTQDDLETEFYELVGSARVLGTIFLDAMEADVNRLAHDRPADGSPSVAESA